MTKITVEKIRDGNQMAYFDVKTFTNVPLDWRIELILKQIYENLQIWFALLKSVKLSLSFQYLIILGDTLTLILKFKLKLMSTFRDYCWIEKEITSLH